MTDTEDSTPDRYDEGTSSLPKTVQEWYGFPSPNPYLVTIDDTPWTAAGCNDNLGMEFPEIADLLEARYING